MEFTFNQFFNLHKEYYLLVKDGNWVPKWHWSIAHRDFLRTDLWRQMRIVKCSISRKACNKCNAFTTIDQGELHHKHYKKPFGLEDIETDLEWLCKKCHKEKHDRK